MSAQKAETSATDVVFAGVVEQARLIRAGELSSRELVESYLDRIFRLDQAINAFRAVYAERALLEADRADARRAAGDDRPLLGVPIAVKDDVDVAGDVTARGTNAHGGPAAADAEIVRRLRGAGAVVVGKTHVPELTIHAFTETPTYGATRNPWALDRTPGGSSGGSAAAVAAGLVGAATASDGAGSIRIPAACSGLVGLKTQRGRVPGSGRGSAWHGLSVPGFLTRRVADTALLYDVVKDSGPSFVEAAARPPGKLRIAVSTRVPSPVMAKVDRTQEGAVESMVRRLQALGHEVVRRDPDYGPVFANILPRYLRGIHDDARAMPHPERLSRMTRGYSRMGSLVPPALLQRALAQERRDAERINAVFDDADLLLLPVLTRLPLRIGELEGLPAARALDVSTRYTPFPVIANYLGQPAIGLPTGSTPDGIPLGVQFLAPPDGEPLLLSLAAQLEASVGWPEHSPPLAA